MTFTLLLFLIFFFFLLFICLLLYAYKIINKWDEVTEIKLKELVVIFLTLLGTGIVCAFVVHKRKITIYLSYIFYRILYHTFQNVFAAGFFAGFMTTAKLGYFYYLFVVPRSVFDNFEDNFLLEHQQTRKATMVSFVIGQLVMFASVYHPTLHRRFFQPRCVFVLFLSFFVLQVFWTYETILKNWNYFIKRNENRKRFVRRIVLIQVEFMLNFFLQLSFLPSNSYIEPYSTVDRLVIAHLNHMGKKVFFVRSSFVGWFIGHVFFMIFYRKVFQLIVIITIWLMNWLRKNFIQKWK